MHRFALLLNLTFVALTTGCATSQNVTLSQTASAKKVTSVALVPSDGNSADMNIAIKDAFAARSIAVQPSLPAGTRKATEVDAIVDYEDQWRWDIVMYLRWVNINLYAADTGTLLASGRFDNSAFHGYPDYKLVVKGIIDDMLNKLNGRSP